MCDKCSNCDCGGCSGDRELNLVRTYTIERQGEQGPPGPAGEVPIPIESNNLFDI